MTGEPFPETSSEWVEVNIHLIDASRTDEALVGFVKPFVQYCNSEGLIQSWHFFREPEIRLRFMGEPAKIHELRKTLDAKLTDLEKRHSGLYVKHLFGSHGTPGQQYVGEEYFWGNDWAVALKHYEHAADTALQILSRGRPGKPLELHAERHLHLFLNQLGFNHYTESMLHWRMFVGYLLHAYKTEASLGLEQELQIRLEAIEKLIAEQAQRTRNAKQGSPPE